MQIRRAAIALLAVATVTACGGDPPAPGPLALDRSRVEFAQVGIDDARADVSALVAAATRIGARLVTPNDRASTTAASPWSVLTLLGMLRAGADGETAAQLDAAGLGGARDLPRAMAALTGQTAQWAGDPGTVPAGNPPAAPLFQSQVALLVSDRTKARASYLDSLARTYGTGVYPIDFTRDVRESLGEWAAVNTGSTVVSVPVRTDSTTRLAAATTAYLAAAWRYPFDAAQTRPRPFATADGVVVEPPTMRATMAARVAAGEGFTALQLDYGIGTLALQVILPNPGLPLAEAATEARFTAARLALAAAPIGAHEISLPKWRSASWIGLVDPLRALGVTGPFANPGLNAIAEGGSILSDARAAAVVTVGEKGTASEAANRPSTTEPQPGPEPFRVDRAFAYSIVDTATGLPLVMGTVNRPTS